MLQRLICWGGWGGDEENFKLILRLRNKLFGLKKQKKKLHPPPPLFSLFFLFKSMINNIPEANK
jgi:hypothetical protein